MILAALCIVMAVVVFRVQPVSPLDDFIAITRTEWIAGLAREYPAYAGEACEGALWLRDKLIQARRITPLSADLAHCIIEQIWIARARLQAANHWRRTLVIRIVTVAIVVLLVRLYLQHLTLSSDTDLILQLSLTPIIGLFIIVTNRHLDHGWFWHSGLSDAGKNWLIGVIDDKYQHDEFELLQRSEQELGASLRAERLAWLQHAVAENSLTTSACQSQLHLRLTLFDLVVLGGVLLGGCLMPIMSTL